MFNLTPQEKKAALFLCLVALTGGAIDFLAKQYPPVRYFVAFSPDIGKVELNQADKQALMSVPGLGEKLSARIIEYRGQKGNFSSIDELKEVKGMNSYRFEKIKGSLYIKE